VKQPRSTAWAPGHGGGDNGRQGAKRLDAVQPGGDPGQPEHSQGQQHLVRRDGPVRGRAQPGEWIDNQPESGPVATSTCTGGQSASTARVSSVLNGVTRPLRISHRLLPSRPMTYCVFTYPSPSHCESANRL